MLQQMLTQDNYKVSLAEGGEKGLKMVQTLRPDLIITDILMPRKDGIETIMALAEMGIDIPIIAMSGGRRAISPEFNLQSAALMGVKTMLAKPFTRGDLRQAIRECIGMG